MIVNYFHGHRTEWGQIGKGVLNCWQISRQWGHIHWVGIAKPGRRPTRQRVGERIGAYSPESAVKSAKGRRGEVSVSKLRE